MDDGIALALGIFVLTIWITVVSFVLLEQKEKIESLEEQQTCQTSNYTSALQIPIATTTMM